MEYQNALFKNSERGLFPHLTKWKNYIEKICKERNETAEIWFDTSSPYANEINIRLDNHKCYWNCVNFRFDEKGVLRAYDSHFGGGTSMVWLGQGTRDEKTEQDVINEVMGKVFDRKCEDSSWNDKTAEKVIHKLDENNWEIKEGWRN